MKESMSRVAANGLLSRRHLLGASLAAPLLVAGQQALGAAPGGPMMPVGRLSAEGEALTRIGVGSQPGTVGSGASRTPLEQLSGTLHRAGCILSVITRVFQRSTLARTS